ncbi:YncE family protein [Desertivirga xinjiangensis]|uniref:YncE family protein n=1 Tax=Desertivirga xinjiangensis TaxID=539206 RepID=UPI002109EEE5|nr:DUF5074 domain-containing protein [Pedobacter xinjiangensis]
MKNLKSTVSVFLISSTLLCSVFSCRKDPAVIPEQEETVPPNGQSTEVRGFYLLNEGNLNMNKASLDYFDFNSGIYRRNIYNETNPEITKGLGDVGNDIGIYGSKLYVVVNVSNKVEVLDAKSGKRIRQIDIANCRYITFHKGRAYVSAYLGVVGDPKAPAGKVSEVDTAALQITREVTVGRQPEEMAVVADKLYVANSGGYSPPDYESTISVIDLSSFTELKRIEVAINLHRLKKDKYGDLYVSSRGDYFDIPSRLFVIDTKDDRVKKVFNTAVSNFCIDQDTAYLYSTEFSYQTGENEVSYKMINVKDETMLDGRFITDGTEYHIKTPQGIVVHPVTKDVFITDAKDYVSPGTLYCFSKEGKKKWQVTTGDIPAHIAFHYY